MATLKQYLITFVDKNADKNGTHNTPRNYDVDAPNAATARERAKALCAKDTFITEGYVSLEAAARFGGEKWQIVQIRYSSVSSADNRKPRKPRARKAKAAPTVDGKPVDMSMKVVTIAA